MQSPSSITYTCEYVVQTYDIEIRRRMTVAALVKQMQEAAMQNVIDMKLSAWDLEPLHISWVLFRKNLQINRLPLVGEKLKFVTYPAGFEKFFTYRDYKVYDQAGELIAFSSSTWLLLDTQARRMAKIPDFILAFEPQMPLPDKCLARPKTKLPGFGNATTEKGFRVNWHDLDFNGHLNNVYYIQWMLEALPDAVLQNDTLREFDIFYKVEAHWKDELMSQVQPIDENSYLHRLLRMEDGKEVAQGMSRFSGVA